MEIVNKFLNFQFYLRLILLVGLITRIDDVLEEVVNIGKDMEKLSFGTLLYDFESVVFGNLKSCSPIFFNSYKVT